MASKLWRVPEASELGRAIQASVGEHALYIADGHHRYHAALKNGQTHLLAYVTEEARILAYNRVVNGVTRFDSRSDREAGPSSRRRRSPPRTSTSFRLYSERGRAGP